MHNASSKDLELNLEIQMTIKAIWKDDQLTNHERKGNMSKHYSHQASKSDSEMK